jgi:hypothetical protein
VALTKAVESGDYKSIVLDPVGEVYMRLLEDLSKRALRPSLPLRGDVSVHLERFCRWLCEAPVHAVFVAHEHSVKDEAAGVVEKLPWTGTNNPSFAEKLMAMVDVIGYTGVVQEEGDTEPRYMATLVNAEGRRGGNRFNLGSARDVDLSEWIEAARQYENSSGKE